MSQYTPPTPPQRQTHYMRPHRGTMVLVFGILGLVQCPIFAILAWILGASDLKAMDQGVMDPSGRDHTKTGKILGMIACIIQIVVISMVCLFYGCLALGMIGAAGAAGAGGGGGGGYGGY